MSPLPLAGDSLSSRSSEAAADVETEAAAGVGTYLEGSYGEILLCGASYGRYPGGYSCRALLDATSVLQNGPLLMPLCGFARNVKEGGTEKASTQLVEKIDNESRAQDMLQSERAANPALVEREGECREN